MADKICLNIWILQNQEKWIFFFFFYALTQSHYLDNKTLHYFAGFQV